MEWWLGQVFARLLGANGGVCRFGGQKRNAEIDQTAPLPVPGNF